jgi:hypothetical protein
MFPRQDDPSAYSSVYAERIAQHANVIINAVYWEPRCAIYQQPF